MSLKVKDVIKIMETIAPPKLAENYDNVGLMVGIKKMK
jgi:putative NIF3 family GTP cyclohydrolase 1 type 2